MEENVTITIEYWHQVVACVMVGIACIYAAGAVIVRKRGAWCCEHPSEKFEPKRMFASWVLSPITVVVFGIWFAWQVVAWVSSKPAKKFTEVVLGGDPNQWD